MVRTMTLRAASSGASARNPRHATTQAPPASALRRPTRWRLRARVPAFGEAQGPGLAATSDMLDRLRQCARPGQFRPPGMGIDDRLVQPPLLVISRVPGEHAIPWGAGIPGRQSNKL